MLIPKCCKGCSNRKSGMCNCALPSYCNEWVEDDETYPTNVGGVINTPNTAPDITVYTDKTYPSIGNWAECPDCKDKDHRIAVLELALWLACEDLQFFDYGEESTEEGEKMKFEYFIEQAEKELEGKE